MKVIPTGETLGATVEGIDLAKPLGRGRFPPRSCKRSANTASCASRRSRSTRRS